MLVQQGKFLGLIVDAYTSEFVVPDDRSECTLPNIAAVLETNAATSRRLASIAGICCLLRLLFTCHYFTPGLHMWQ